MESSDCEIRALLHEILDNVSHAEEVCVNEVRPVSFSRDANPVVDVSIERNLDDDRNVFLDVGDENVPGRIGGAVCIFYTDSPFSDFHSSPFMEDGKYYHSLEHFFQIQMIFSFGMFRLAQKIREIPDAATFRKTLRQNLRTMVKSELFDEKMFAEWRKKNAFKMMRRGNKAKFEQNFTLKEQLLATGDRILIFTAKNDSLLGVGMTETAFLHWLRTNRFCLEDLLDFFSGTRPRPAGLGRNYLGLALMEVRSELSGKPSVIYDWRQQRPNIAPEDWIQPEQPTGAKETSLQQQGQSAPVETSASLPTELQSYAGKENEPQELTSLANEPISSVAADHSVSVSETSSQNHITPCQLPTYSLEGCLVDATVSRFHDQQRKQFAQLDTSGTLQPEDLSHSQQNSTEQTATEQTTSNEPTKVATVAEREVIILPFEKRIVYQRKDAQPKVIGETTDDASASSDKRRTRQSRWEKKEASMSQNPPPLSSGPNTKEKNLSVLERLKSLRLDKPMINPFSLGNDKYDSFLKPAKNKEMLLNTYQEDGSEIMAEDEEEAPSEQRERRDVPLYPSEPGEIPPDGWMPRYSYQLPKIVGRPAGLPFHLLRSLPPGPPPPGMENYGPSHFQYPLAELKKLGRPRRGPSPPPMYYPTYVPAPKEDSEMKKWEPPTDPAKKIKQRARKLIEEAKARLERENMEKRIKIEEQEEEEEEPVTFRGKERSFMSSEEGGTPLTYHGRPKKIVEEVEMKQEIKEEPGEEEEPNLALDRKIFPFGMEATLADLIAMGFVPPPILTDPQCRARNLGRSKDSWQFYFENREAAFRHAANRWVRAGRLTTTGEYEETSGDEEEINFDYESSEDEEAEEEFQRRKKRFDTKIVYLDTFQYEEYVRYYQQNHGCTPLPQEISGESLSDISELRNWYQYYRTAVNPYMEADPELREGAAGTEQLFSNLSDFYAVSRWKWDNPGKESIIDTRFIPQEQWDNGVEFEAKPVTYEYDPKELEEWKEHEEKMKIRTEAVTEPEVVDLENESDNPFSKPEVVTL